MIKNRFFKLISVLLAVIITGALLSSCGKSDKKLDFIYPFNADISSYDPQIASTPDEYLVIENAFEGLIRLNDDGTVIPGCAESWEISSDGLIYTFHIQKGLKWDITTDKYKSGSKKGEYKDRRIRFLGYEFNPEITSDDFLFALQRACAAETASPMFPSVSAIKNAVEVNSGKADVSSLGVSAPDEYTLVITLSSPDGAFLETLSTAVAMPCNREFFAATKGRYGLELKYTLFNGQFYIDQLLEESYLLKKNKEYKGPSPSHADELTLKIINPEDEKDLKKSTVARLKSGYFDAALISGAEKEKLGDETGITYVPYTDTTWVMMFNSNNEILQSKNMRKAFCLGLSDVTSTDKEYLGGASNFVPEACSLSGTPVAQAIGSTVPAQNTEKSIKLWNKGLEIIDETDITLTVLATADIENGLKSALQGIQSGISAINKNKDGDVINCSVKIEILELGELEARLKKRDYDIALYPYKAVSASPITFLKAFSEKNRTGFDSAKFDKELVEAEKAKSTSDALLHIKNAEKELISSYTLFPIISQTSYCAMADNVSGIQFHAGSGRVSFVSADRKR